VPSKSPQEPVDPELRARSAALDAEIVSFVAAKNDVDPELLLDVLILAREGSKRARRAGFSDALSDIIARSGVTP